MVKCSNLVEVKLLLVILFHCFYSARPSQHRHKELHRLTSDIFCIVFTVRMHVEVSLSEILNPELLNVCMNYFKCK